MKAGWSRKSLAEIGSIFNGNTVSDSDKKTRFSGNHEGLPYIATKDVGFDNVIDYEAEVTIPVANLKDFKIAPKNTVFVCAEGGSAGRKIAHNDRQVCFGNKLFAIAPSSMADSRYVFYFCLSSDFKAQFKEAMAGLIGGVSISKFKSLSLPVPPLPEQLRIVTILDQAFAGIAVATANAEKNLAEARELFQSHLHSVFAENTKGWRAKQLGSLCQTGRPITYGVIKLGNEVSDGIPCLRTSNVRWLKIETEGMKRIAPTLSNEYSRTILKGGEVLVNVRGTLGGVAVATDKMVGWNVSREVAVVPVDLTLVNPLFVSYFIGASASQKWLGDVKKGAAYVEINLEDLRLLPVVLPSLSEQSMVIDRIEEIHSEAKHLEAIYQQKLVALEGLKKSILNQAFSGQLN